MKCIAACVNLMRYVYTRAGIDMAIVDNIVDKALSATVDKHASLSTHFGFKYKNNNSEERLIPHEITAPGPSIGVCKSKLNILLPTTPK